MTFTAAVGTFPSPDAPQAGPKPTPTIDPQTTVMMVRDLADVVRNLAGRIHTEEHEVDLVPALRESVAALARLVWSAENWIDRFPEDFQVEFHQRYDDFFTLLLLIPALDRAIEHPDELPFGAGFGVSARICADAATDIGNRFVEWADALEPKYDPGIRDQEVAHV